MFLQGQGGANTAAGAQSSFERRRVKCVGRNVVKGCARPQIRHPHTSFTPTEGGRAATETTPRPVSPPPAPWPRPLSPRPGCWARLSKVCQPPGSPSLPLAGQPRWAWHRANEKRPSITQLPVPVGLGAKSNSNVATARLCPAPSLPAESQLLSSPSTTSSSRLHRVCENRGPFLHGFNLES